MINSTELFANFMRTYIVAAASGGNTNMVRRKVTLKKHIKMEE